MVGNATEDDGMHLVGPFRYVMRVGADGYSVSGEDGRSGFTAPVTHRGPKIYVFSSGTEPLYVGQAVRDMRGRIRDGFNANGKHGYHGYAWRRELAECDLSVWCLCGVAEGEWGPTLECIEAEVVFACRAVHGQWPRYQSEIHFHQTSPEHRLLASQIFSYFGTRSGKRSGTLAGSNVTCLDDEERKRLEDAGFQVGDAAEFLGLSAGERAEVEERLAAVTPTPFALEVPQELLDGDAAGRRRTVG